MSVYAEIAMIFAAFFLNAKSWLNDFISLSVRSEVMFIFPWEMAGDSLCSLCELPE